MDALFNVVLVGESKVGKTSFLNSCVGDKVSEEYLQTIGINYGEITRQLELYEQIYTMKMRMWDWSWYK